MTSLDTYAVSRRTVEAALALEGDTLDDYDPTIFGLINDGVEWQVFEDSLDEKVALEWADRGASYGEIIGLYVWSGSE